MNNNYNIKLELLKTFVNSDIDELTLVDFYNDVFAYCLGIDEQYKSDLSKNYGAIMENGTIFIDDLLNYHDMDIWDLIKSTENGTYKSKHEYITFKNNILYSSNNIFTGEKSLYIKDDLLNLLDNIFNVDKKTSFLSEFTIVFFTSLL